MSHRGLIGVFGRLLPGVLRSFAESFGRMCLAKFQRKEGYAAMEPTKNEFIAPRENGIVSIT